MCQQYQAVKQCDLHTILSIPQSTILLDINNIVSKYKLFDGVRRGEKFYLLQLVRGTDGAEISEQISALAHPGISFKSIN